MYQCSQFIFLVLFLSISSISSAIAHDPRPVLIDIYQDDTRAGELKLEWKIPGSLSSNKHPLIGFSDFCNVTQKYPIRYTGEAFYGGANFLCSGNTTGSPYVLNLIYPLGNPSLSSFIRLHENNFAGDKRTSMFLLKPDELSWSIPQSLEPPSASPSLIAQAYLDLGFNHILKGWDHLLFLICLMALSRIPKKIFFAITGFTVGHSLTLAAASLNILTLPVMYVETLISLSIVLVCVELLQTSRNTFSRTYPVLISLFFGLVHGLGFANELISIGFPEDGLVAALLFFNLGVEAGQLTFVVPVILLGFAARRFIGSSGKLYGGLGYKFIFFTIGFIACYWFVERSLQF
ncbi:MAG: hypothetical protein CML73_01055 [Rhodobiaceae bacterium]|nr:hypothetical protein [Rhodobiaceae bacterium]